MEALPSGSGSKGLFITRRTLYNKMRECRLMTLRDQALYMKKYIKKRCNTPLDKMMDLEKSISFFISDFKKRWQEACRKEDRFLSKNKNWLDSAINFPVYEVSSTKNVGRPSIDFATATDRTKRHKTMDLRAKHSPEELSYATHMSLRSSGFLDASKVVKDVTLNSPSRATKYRTAFRKLDFTRRQLTGIEALAMCVDAKLTRYQYNIIREKDIHLFPSYKIVQLAKKDCYPIKESITVTDTSAEVKLQALLDHTTSRLLEAQKPVLESQITERLKKMFLICKWGFDGSAQAEYKQKFTNDPKASDANMFITSLVPLRLVSTDKKETIFWQNNRSSSTRYCRPIKFQFEHESAELIRRENIYIKEQINQLDTFIYELGEKQIEVTYKMFLTMVDGKICNSITENKSTQRCYICNLTSKHFNNLDKVTTTEIADITRLEFGLSVLHANIRFFECLLHLSYKLPFKQWQSRGEKNKQIMQETKKHIQQRFKIELGLSVDKPKPGFGNSNDGNTARRFFQNHEISASITGIDIDVIRRFKVVLQAISCSYDLREDKFRMYALETAKLFVDKYSWYPMPPTVHKILIHGPEIIKYAILPIGQLSEEAQEARHKEFKKYRELYTRKFSRLKTNEDIFNLLFISSDPLVTSLRKIPHRKITKLDAELISLLKQPDVLLSSQSTGSSDNSSDDE